MSDHDAAMKSSLHQWIGATAVAAALACGGGTANAQTAASATSQGNAFHAPPVFTGSYDAEVGDMYWLTVDGSPPLLDPHEARAFHHGLQPAAYGFDFGKLGHG